MRESDLCPCCKRPRTTIPIDDLDVLDALPKPRKEQLALDAMVLAFPSSVSGDQMMQALYEDVGDGEPETRNSLMAHISKLRKKLRSIGWDIDGRRFVGYRLCRFENGREAA
ncbi:helix-turn-helix domain-containing protein [Shinella sumterensis]|uniref:helix-turn-helix domain-containing protein n=1 Tax=Shinella sumterensis TaxID=1967501 RepID=UPI001ADA23C0|nr:helix-turn-helix domain-containing protein [Shinella sumterensis]